MKISPNNNLYKLNSNPEKYGKGKIILLIMQEQRNKLKRHCRV